MSPFHGLTSQKTAAFGAALTALALVDTPANAAIVALTPAPGTLPFQGATGGGTIALQNTGTGGSAVFFQFNSSGGKSIGVNSIGWLPVAYGSPITSGLPFNVGAIIPATATGTATFAFHTTIFNRQGWVRMNLGGTGGPITYLAAAWDNTPGGNILAGTLSPVPEPTSLALAGIAALAVGAGYVRNRRKAAKV